MERTPVEITEKIVELCDSIVKNRQPIFVSVDPKEGCIENYCFPNVQKIVNLYGGEAINGWIIWQWDNILVEAEAHCIWKDNNNIFIDITQHTPVESKILFLPDDSIKYEGNQINNIYLALSDSLLVKEYIELLNEVFALQKPHPLGKAVVFPQDIGRYNQIKTRLAELEQLFSKKVGRNEQCPCGSGFKYKWCCGKYR